VTTEAGAGWRPRAGVELARLRARLLAEARDYFREQDVLEVDVPAIGPAAVTDVQIESIAVRSMLDAASGRERYLMTSPEYSMKRLLAAGFPDIGFIGKVYRDGEAGRHHQPEFTMIEWYRLGFDIEAIMTDAERFIERLLGDRIPAETPARISYSEAFQRHLGLDPLTAGTDELVTAAGADTDLTVTLGEDRDAWLDLLFATKVAPQLSRTRLTTLHHYPASQAALARLGNDARVAERFEVMLGELELANGYVELTDATEQRARFDTDQSRRQAGGRGVRPVDEPLLAALEAGLPDCAGVAVGFDRLLMLAAGATDIRDVRHFCWETT
jgi:lysyl-tRNA synthetase class 2